MVVCHFVWHMVVEKDVNDGCRKSVRSDGLLFCIAHGGGKRCEHDDCTKSAVSGVVPFCTPVVKRETNTWSRAIFDE